MKKEEERSYYALPLRRMGLSWPSIEHTPSLGEWEDFHGRVMNIRPPPRRMELSLPSIEHCHVGITAHPEVQRLRDAEPWCIVLISNYTGRHLPSQL